MWTECEMLFKMYRKQYVELTGTYLHSNAASRHCGYAIVERNCFGKGKLVLELALWFNSRG